jgi:hypothetical protein
MVLFGYAFMMGRITTNGFYWLSILSGVLGFMMLLDAVGEKPRSRVVIVDKSRPA